MNSPSSPDVTAFLDNSDPGHTLDQYLQQAMPAAQKLCICTGYVSAKGLQLLADWLDQMGPQGEAQLLIGMPPTGWKYPPSTAAAGATYIRRHIGADAGPLDPEVWQRLAALEETGRLTLRLRVPFHAMHAKLYLWQTAAGAWRGVSGSSNLTHSGLAGTGELNAILTTERARWAVRWFENHWQAQASRPAPQVWQELRDAWPLETTREAMVPAADVPTRRSLAPASTRTSGSMGYRLMGSLVLFIVGVTAYVVYDLWVVGIGFMIAATVLLPRPRRGRRRRHRSRW